MRRLLLDSFRAGYMQRALVEMLVLSAVAGTCSVFVLLRRLAFASDALTHTIFPGAAIAFAVGTSLFAGALVAGLLSAVVLTLATRFLRADDDAVLGVLLGSFFAVGVVVVSRSSSYTADLTGLLFGRVLAVEGTDIVVTAVVAGAVLAALGLFGKELVLRAFDPLGAAALGYPPAVLDLLLNVAVALVVVAAVKAVGTVLVIALLVTPAASARLVCQRIGRMIVVSCGLAGLCGWLGLALSYDLSLHHGLRLASGASIVVVLTTAFLVTAAASATWRAAQARGS
jgi:manganese/iron transport system permease protein